MGCSDSKETSEINILKFQCEKLCQENLSILKLLEYLLIENNNLSEAILLLSLKKRTESYYSIIYQYRNFWITEAKKSFKGSGDSKHLSICLKEQEREKTRLLFTRQALQEQIDKLRPGWQDLHKTLKNFNDVLESNSIIMQRSSSLYGSLYHQDLKELKLAALKYCKNIAGLPGNVYLAVKSVTVTLYKIPENRVYFTNKIVHEKQSTCENQLETSEKNEISRKNEDSVVYTLNHTTEIRKNKSIELPKTSFDKSKLRIDLDKLSIDQSKNKLDRARTSLDARFADQVRLSNDQVRFSTDQGRLSIDQIRSSSDQRGSNAETLQKYLKPKERYEKLSESFSSSIEDEETLARLSYTQK